MSFETIIPFVIKHNAVIIQALVALILLLVALLAFRNFLRSGDAGGAAVGSANLEQLEGTLKKLLERAGQVPSVPANAESSQLVSEIETLRASLAEKQEQIEQMKVAPVATAGAGASPAAAPAAAGLSSDEKRTLEEQIRDLQAKLAEYEIISEDIADLSFYKEENVKLQKQLEGLKTGAVGEASVDNASVPPATSEAVIPVAPAAAAPSDIDPAQAMVDSLMATPPEQLAAPRDSAADEDLLKEFADAVSAQGGPVSPGETSTGEEKAVAAEASEPDVTAGLFDVERMTQEAGQLQQLAATVGDVPASEVLEAGLDAERLAAEAASMESIKPEDAKLMGDFEEFMKKGGT